MTRPSISFDHAADFYDSTRDLGNDLAPKLTEALLRELAGADTSHALEVGVGTGRIARPLAERGIRVTGVDIAPRMLARLVDQLGPHHVVPDLLLADATRLPLRSDSFSAILLCHLLHLIPDWQLAVSEMARVLAPRGILLHHGDHTIGESDWDVAYDKWIELFDERHFKRRVRPKIEDMSAAFEAIGGSCRTETILEWEEQSTPGMEMELARNRIHSWTWEVPDALFFDCLPEVERWAVEHYGGLETPLVRRVAYRLQVWKLA